MRLNPNVPPGPPPPTTGADDDDGDAAIATASATASHGGAGDDAAPGQAVAANEHLAQPDALMHDVEAGATRGRSPDGADSPRPRRRKASGDHGQAAEASGVPMAADEQEDSVEHQVAPRGSVSLCTLFLLILFFPSSSVCFFSSMFSAVLIQSTAVTDLLGFLQAHAGDVVLDAAAMAQLQEELVPAALAAWPGLQQVLQTKTCSFLDDEAVYPWTAAGGFAAPLTREQVFALTQQLMLQVRLPMFVLACGPMRFLVCLSGTFPCSFLPLLLSPLSFIHSFSSCSFFVLYFTFPLLSFLPLLLFFSVFSFLSCSFFCFFLPCAFVVSSASHYFLCLVHQIIVFCFLFILRPGRRAR